MTNQECIWMDEPVIVVGIVSKSGLIHPHVKKYVGRVGVVTGESKNNMLRVLFPRRKNFAHLRNIPAGCLMKLNAVNFAI